MAEPIDVALFCEDQGHEQFVRALVKRLASDLSISVEITTRTARGGHGRAITELKAWQRLISKGHTSSSELLVVVIDANCRGWRTVHSELQRTIDESLFPYSILGCPDPHIERWCLADPESFARVVEGPAPKVPAKKCERSFYKDLLRNAILAAGQPIVINEMEYAPDLVQAMDLYQAGKRQPSLKHFHDGLRAALADLAKKP